MYGYLSGEIDNDPSEWREGASRRREVEDNPTYIGRRDYVVHRPP